MRTDMYMSHKMYQNVAGADELTVDSSSNIKGDLRKSQFSTRIRPNSHVLSSHRAYLKTQEDLRKIFIHLLHHIHICIEMTFK